MGADTGSHADAEIDTDALRTEIEQIKDAMGLQERYPSRFHLWLVYGVLVALAAAASQFVVLNRLPGWFHPIAWFVCMGIAGLVQWVRVDGREESPAVSKPNIALQFGAIFAYYGVVLAVMGVLPSVSYLLESAVIFGMVVGLVGVGYVVAGSSLAAYYIRKRDRYAFYAGGLWMLPLAVAIPVVPPLRTWGYAVFGGLYLVHSVAAYRILQR